MKRKMFWLVVSGLVALSLVMAACGPAAVEEKKAPVVEEKKQEAPVVKEAVKTAAEAPKYGGVIKLGLASNIISFDEITGSPPSAVTLHLTNEELLRGDWAKGPAGTNETNWQLYNDVYEHKAGYLADSWEIPELGTIVYKIRKGVHWALNPNSEASRLVNGRELTADDVVFSLKQYITNPMAYLYKTNPRLQDASISAPDKYTVIIKTPLNAFGEARSRFSDLASIIPPEVVNKYGNMAKWQNSVGSGPFMLTDFVSDSSATLVRNPNYWMKDPVGPGKGNQLPYLDGVMYLIIPDLSTLYAALRTAKVDWIFNVGWEDAASFKKTTPKLMSNKYNSIPWHTHMRTDKPPFNDMRVRRALMMATDFETIVRDYYGGEAQILTWPLAYLQEYGDAYLGLDDPEMPASVKELYTYNPDKARALLKEAGYPQGFNTSIIVESKLTVIDYYSIISAMWAKVGVNLAIEPKELAVFTSIRTGRKYEQMIWAPAPPPSQLYLLLSMTGTSVANNSYINDPYVNEVLPQMTKLAVTNRTEANRLHKELMKYALDKAWVIPTPSAPLNTFWWPWVKNYHGELQVGFTNSIWQQFVWIDQALKKSMGY